MASIQFKDTVTKIPADWANDVNRLVYDLFQNPKALSDVKDTLGLQILTEGGAIKIINGSVDQTPIGMFTPAPAKFTTIQVTQPGAGDGDVATLGSVRSAVADAIKNFKDMATQAANAVAITGGTLVGVSVKGTGEFTSLKVTADAATDNDVVRYSQFLAKFAALPTTGTAASQNADAVNYTGGSINGVVIGATTAAEATFTNVKAVKVTGSSGSIDLSGAGVDGVGVSIAVTSANNKHANVVLAEGGAFSVVSGAAKVVMAGGRLALGTGNDDGVNQLQVNGSATATKVVVTSLNPTVDGELTSKKWVEDQIAAAKSGLSTQIGSATSGLGSMSTQSANNVNISGGAINGTTIGNSAPAAAYFTTATTKVLAGTGVILALNNADATGYSNAAGSLTISDTVNPNFSVNFGATGVFAFTNGSANLARIYGNGNLVIGSASGDDGANKLQVYGDIKLKGKLSIGAGTALPTGTATPVLGTAAPTLADTNAKWVPVTIVTDAGDIACVMPVWKL